MLTIYPLDPTTDWTHWVRYIKETQQHPNLLDLDQFLWLADEWLVIKEQNEIIGSIGIQYSTIWISGTCSPICWPVNSYVREAWRGHGYGVALYAALKGQTPIVLMAWGQPTAQLLHLATKAGPIQAQCELTRWVADGQRFPHCDPNLCHGQIIVLGDQIHRLQRHPQQAYRMEAGAIWRREGRMIRMLWAHGEIPEQDVAWVDYYTSSPEDFSPQGFRRLAPDETQVYPHLLSPIDRRPQTNTFVLCSESITGLRPEDCRFTRLDGGRDQPR